jgi:hypothetical protein
VTSWKNPLEETIGKVGNAGFELMGRPKVFLSKTALFKKK